MKCAISIKEFFMKKKLVSILIAVLGVGLFAKEYYLRTGDTHPARMIYIQEICPVSDSVCKIRYDNNLVEYIKIGDKIYLNYGIEPYKVISFDYNFIVCEGNGIFGK